MVDAISELHKDFDRTLRKIEWFEVKEKEKGLDIRENREFREWLSLSANIAERIFLLEGKDKYHVAGEDERLERKNRTFREWIMKVEDGNDKDSSGKKKDFREGKVSKRNE